MFGAPNVGRLSSVWSVIVGLVLQMRGIYLAFGGFGLAYRSKRSRYRRSLTKLALEVHRTSNLSEFPLRVAFARAMLRSSMSSAHANHSRIPNELPRESALPSSIETKADLACVESTPCFQL